MADLQLLAFDWSTFPCALTPSNHSTGYVRDGHGKYLHRVLYEAEVGPIPAGLTIDHLCNHKNCLETFHMEPVTSGENTRRAFVRSGLLVDISRPCSHGHPPEWRNWGKQGWKCAACNREACRRRSRGKVS